MSESASPRHVPVLLERVLDLLAPALERPDAIMVDATLGLGGHTAAVLDRFPHARVIGLDRDEQALEQAQQRLADQDGALERTTFVHAVYDTLPEVLAEHGTARVAAVFFDLGVSSMQLDVADRGFAYARDAPLDMRMDRSVGFTAADVLNDYSERDLTRILRNFGEERFAPRISAAVVRERQQQPFTTSARLVELIRSSIPAAARRTGGHPAKRTFQALRIEVNGELNSVREAMPAAIGAIGVGGRLIVLAYHSLEDRLVKRALSAASTLDVPPDLPVVPDHLQPVLTLLTRGAEKASAEEIEANPRAQSVRLRAAMRIREAA